MDVFSHGLWAGVAAKGINLSAKKPRRINPWLAGFWGVFPDIFAFGLSFIWLFYQLLFGTLDRSTIPNPDALEPAPEIRGWAFQLSATLYNYSHSLIIFILVIIVVVLIKYFFDVMAIPARTEPARSGGHGLPLHKRLIKIIPWEMGGWLVHILCDIPTHSYRFYPTPIFWPLSSWKFNGFSWGVWWFMLLNYSALFIVFLIIYFKKKKFLKNKI